MNDHMLTPQLKREVAKQESDRQFVLDHMLASGPNRKLLSDRQWHQVYMKGDGIRNLDPLFMPVNLANAPIDGVNVTNSTPEGFFQMARMIEKVLG